MESTAELLPDELICEILSRLPVKSLLRFMCVAKSWCSLIKSPQFIKSHLKTSKATNRKLIFSTFHPIPSMDLFLTECDLNSALHAPMTEATNLLYPNFSPMPQEKAVEIIGSCNGLVCLATDRKHTSLFLWNPSIRRYKKLPHWGLEIKSSSLASYGFAYDELRDDYKVVAVIVYRTSWDPNVSPDRCIGVYSQRTNSWKRIKGPENSSVPQNWGFNSCGTFTNGKFHWIALYPPHRIVSFDLADEAFREIEFPPENMRAWGSSIWATGVLGEGYLALLWQPDWRKLVVDVWIMTEYGVGESWTKLYSIRYPHRAHHCPGYMHIQPLLGLERGEFLFKLGSRLVIYNPEDDSCKDLNISHNLRQISDSLKVNMYNESLVLLDAYDG